MDIIKELSGHSGCKVLLVRDDSRTFVRKIAANKEYSERLVVQSNKQASFSSPKEVFAPVIFKNFYDNDIYGFDMEYIVGRSFAESLPVMPILKMIEIIRKILDIVDIQESGIYLGSHLFERKILDLKSKISHKDNCIDYAFEILGNHDWSKIYKSKCHGDLTLENILISKDNKIYLIDFLDSFADSWMIDIAKILQDIQLGWAYRYIQRDTNLNLRCMVVSEIIKEIIVGRFDESTYNEIQFLLLLNMLRIVPYIKDEKTAEFINSSIQELNKELSNI